MALLGDVGEVEELIEGAGDVREQVFGNVRQAATQPFPVRIRAPPRRLRQRPNVLDEIDKASTPMPTDHATKNVAQEANILPQFARNPGECITLVG